MADAMVVARMSASKKQAVNHILHSLGSNASQIVNELYDYVLAQKSLPWNNSASSTSGVNTTQLRDALEWVNSLSVTVSPEFKNLSIKEARGMRLAKA